LIEVPISIVAFLRQADLSGPIWIVPLFAWVAVLYHFGFWMSHLMKPSRKQLGKNQLKPVNVCN
jgi:hypothetical protein